MNAQTRHCTLTMAAIIFNCSFAPDLCSQSIRTSLAPTLIIVAAGYVRSRTVSRNRNKTSLPPLAMYGSRIHLCRIVSKRRSEDPSHIIHPATSTLDPCSLSNPHSPPLRQLFLHISSKPVAMDDECLMPRTVCGDDCVRGYIKAETANTTTKYSYTMKSHASLYVRTSISPSCLLGGQAFVGSFKRRPQRPLWPYDF